MKSNKEDKKDKIMEVAFETIKKYGFKRVTLEDIAHASGMAITSIYYYFPSKNALINTTFSHFFNTILEQIDLVVKSQQSPEQKLIACLEISFSSIKESGYLLNMDKKTMTQMVSLAEELINKFEKGYQERMRKILLEGKKRGTFQIEDINLWVLFLSVGLSSLIKDVNAHKQVLQDEKFIKKISKMLMVGLRTK